MPAGHDIAGLQRPQAIDGLGPLQYQAQRGLLLHPTYVVTPGRERLGLLDSWHWAREPRDADGSRPSEITPSEITESQRWVDGYERYRRECGRAS